MKGLYLFMTRAALIGAIHGCFIFCFGSKISGFLFPYDDESEEIIDGPIERFVKATAPCHRPLVALASRAGKRLKEWLSPVKQRVKDSVLSLLGSCKERCCQCGSSEVDQKERSSVVQIEALEVEPVAREGEEERGKDRRQEEEISEGEKGDEQRAREAIVEEEKGEEERGEKLKGKDEKGQQQRPGKEIGEEEIGEKERGEELRGKEEKGKQEWKENGDDKIKMESEVDDTVVEIGNMPGLKEVESVEMDAVRAKGAVAKEDGAIEESFIGVSAGIPRLSFYELTGEFDDVVSRKSLTGQDGQAKKSADCQDTVRRISTNSKRGKESESLVRVEVHREAVMANDDDIDIVVVP